MRRALAWIMLAALMGCSIYGFVHERLFAQWLWTSQGLTRLLICAGAFWAIAGLILWIRPKWLIPVMGLLALSYSVWWCALFFEAIAPLAVIYFLGSSFLLGKLMAQRADGITAFLPGLAMWIFAISIAVHFRINTRGVYFAAFAIPYVASWRYLRGASLRPQLNGMLAPRPIALAVLLFVLFLHWLVALKPEVSSDGLGMHLAVPAIVARDARWAFDFREHTWALMPMGGDWVYTAAYLLGGEAAARLLNFVLLVVITILIYQASQRWVSPTAAVLAAALFASTPMVQLVTGSLMVENVWAVLILGGALAALRGELVWAAVLFGAALSTKVGTIAFLAPAALIGAAMLAQKQDARNRWRIAAAAAIMFVVFAAPPYLNSWVKTHNPLYPFLNNVFHSPYFDTTPNSVRDARFRNPVNWKTPYETTFRSKEYFEGQNGSLGFQYFLLLPPLWVLISRKSPRAVLALGTAGAILILAGQPNLRYLYPALPLFSIGIAWLVSEIPMLLGAVVALIALNLWFLPASNWYHHDFALFDESDVAKYLEASAPQRKLVEYLNGTYPGEAVAFFGGPAIAGLNARSYSDTWHTYAFWKRMIHSQTPAEVAVMFREPGIRHVIAPAALENCNLVMRRFLEQWTAPTSVTSGHFVLRDVLATPIPELSEKTPAAAGTYDDLDPRIEYRGSWMSDCQFSQAAGGSITCSDVPGDALRFWFSGTAITYVYTRAANRGVAQIVIDGRTRASIDLYSHETQWQGQTVFGSLEPGPHTIEVRVMERKNPRSSNYYVDLDRFVVQN